MRTSPSMNPETIRGSQEFYSVVCPECDGRLFAGDTLRLCPKCDGNGRLLIPETPPRDLANRPLLRYMLRYVLIAAAVVILIAVAMASR